jgi:hypothetical protein
VPYLSREERDLRRIANQRSWAADPRNINTTLAAERAAREASEYHQVDIDSVDHGDALNKLRDMMLDGTVPLSRRMKAAAAILRYEVPPGGLAGKDKDEITSTAYKFFCAIATADVAEEHQQNALEQMLLVENQKARVVDKDAVAAEREVGVMAANTARRSILACTHTDTKRPSRWWLSTSDDVELPELPGISESLDELLALPEDEIKARARARDAILLQVEARNRDDRSWRAVLQPSK